MVKVVDFKDKAIGLIDKFRANARALPMLLHARYAIPPQDGVTGSQRVKGVNFGLRHHKPHQIHSTHRETVASVLQWLVRKLDVRTRECVFVNPSRGIRRAPYVPEMARELGLCERTITRCLGTLARSRYLLRTAKRFFVSRSLFKDLSLDVTYDRLCNQLAGLAKKNAKNPFTRSPQAPAPGPSNTTDIPAAHREFEKDGPPLPKDIDLGNSFLRQMRGLRSSKPPD